MRYAARTDTTAKALIVEAQRAGWEYHPLGGAIDGLLWYPWTDRVLLVDWKSSRKIHKQKDGRTETQRRLVDKGWPLHFVACSEELTALLNRMTIESDAGRGKDGRDEPR